MTVTDIINIVCEVTGVSKEQLTGASRKRNIIMARELAVHYLILNTNKSLCGVGMVINRNHSSVFHLHKVYMLDMRHDKQLKTLSRQVAERLSKLKPNN